MDMYIVLAVAIFMMVMFVWHKVPFGLTTMTCCIILTLTGVIDVEDSFQWIWQQDRGSGCAHAGVRNGIGKNQHGR